MFRKIFCLFSLLVVLFSLSLEATTVTVNVNTDAAVGSGGSGVGTTGDLRYVLNFINQNPDVYDVVFTLSPGQETITIQGMLPILNLNAANNVVIDGGNSGGSGVQVTIDGNNTHRGFFAQQGTISIQNLTIQNTLAGGGNGGLRGGGGGLGAGSGLFINQADVAIANLTFINSAAAGGNGGDGGFGNGGGGGGMGGNGGSAEGGGGGLGGHGGNGSPGGGGGGIAPGGGGGSGVGAPGAAGGGIGGTSAGNGAGGALGGASGGGGGAGSAAPNTAGGGGGVGGIDGAVGIGGDGGFGGGGGCSTGGINQGGAGGFGGGGGRGGANGSVGGFGGGSGGGSGGISVGGFGGGGGGTFNLFAPIAGGVGGGQGGVPVPADTIGGGGGGAGLGGAIFVTSGMAYGGGGGTLVVEGPLVISGSSVAFGSGGSGGANGANGAAGGSDIFAITGAPLVFNLSAAQAATVNGSIGDDSASTLPGPGYTPGAGAGVSVVKQGGGTLSLLGINTYQGGTEINQGTLQILADTGLGAPGVTLNFTGDGTLQAVGSFASSRPIDVGANNAAIDTNGNNVDWSGVISGAGGSLTKEGAGDLTLTAANTYSESTTINDGTLALSGGGSFNANAAMQVNNPGTFDISAIAPAGTTIGDLSGDGIVELGAKTLTTGTATPETTFSGEIQGTGGLTKVGTGRLILSGNNSYTGLTDILQGILEIFKSTDTMVDVNAAVSAGAALNLEQAVGTTGLYTGSVVGPGDLYINQSGSQGTVQFNDPIAAITGATTVFAGTLSGTVATLPLAVGVNTGGTVNIEQVAGTGTYAGVVSDNGVGEQGSVSINQNGGVGRVILSNVNTYTGATTIFSGSLQIAPPNIQGDTIINGGALLDFEQAAGSATYSNDISGAGTVAINDQGGAGRVVLDGTNTYTGGTTVFSGSLQGTTTSLQGDITVNGGALVDFEQASGSGTYSGQLLGPGAVAINDQGGTGRVIFTGANAYSGGTTVFSGSLQGTTTSLQGDITVNGGALVDFEQASGFGTYSGQISGPGSVAINDQGGNGRVVFSGPNIYTGGTTVSSGSLQGTTTSLQGDIAINAGALVDFEQAAGTATYSGQLSGAGTLAVNDQGGNGRLVLSGANTYSGATIVFSGSLQGTTTSLQGNIGINAGAVVDFEQLVGSGTYSGQIFGPGMVAINDQGGAGTVIFSGNNSYTGGTTVHNGTLQGTTNSIQGNVVVNGGAVLDFEQASGTGNYFGSIAGAGSVVINSLGTSNGTVVFAGANSYTGGTFVNGGTLRGNTISLQGTITDNATVTFNQTFNGAFNGSLLGGGILNVTGPGILFFNTSQSGFAGTTNIQQGTLLLNSSLGGNLFIQNGGFLKGNGSVLGNLTVQNGGTIDPGNSVGTITVNGNYTQNSGGIYQVDVSGLQSSLINVLGQATLANGSTLLVNPIGAILRNLYTILSAGGGLNGTFTNVNTTTHNLPLVALKTIYDSNNAYLSIDIDFGVAAETFNEQQVVDQLNTIPDDPPPDLQALLQAFFPLTVSEAQKALNQMSGEQYTNVLLTAEFANRNFIKRLFDPLRYLITTNPCAPPVYCYFKPTFDLWFSGAGGRTFIDGNKNAKGFRISNYDLALGAQSTFIPCWTLGAAVFYEKDNISYKVGGFGRSNLVLGAVYGLYRPKRFYLLSDITFGCSRNTIRRRIEIGDVNFKSCSNPKVWQTCFYIEGGTDIPCYFMLIQPFLGFEVGHYCFDRFKERGNNVVKLIVYGKSYTAAYSRLGIHFTSAPLQCGCSMAVDLAWYYRLTPFNNNIHERFKAFGDKFKIKGLPLQRNSYEAIVSICQRIGRCWEVFFEATGQGWDKAFDYSFVGGVRTTW